VENRAVSLHSTILYPENITSNMSSSLQRKQWPKIIGIEQIFHNMEIEDTEGNNRQASSDSEETGKNAYFKYYFRI